MVLLLQQDSTLRRKESCLFMNKLSPLGSKQHASRMRVAVSFVPPTHYRFIYRTTSQCRPVVTVAEPGGGKMRNVCNGRQLQYKNNRLQLEMLGCNCRIPGCNRSCSAAIADCGYAMQASRPRGFADTPKLGLQTRGSRTYCSHL